ncbi:MAG: TAXI family TRAP transporter solute-binding subunit [Vicinamibacterales bacterium]
MRRAGAAITGLALAVVLAACGGGSAGRAFISIGTAPIGGAFFVVGSALAEVLGAATADRGWQVNAENTSGSQENIRRLDQGELQFALSNAAITYFAVRGTEGWDKAYPMRSVMTLAPNVALFLTKSGSGITRIVDLKGKRVVIGPAGAGFEYFVRPILQAHGVGYDELTALNATQQAAVDLLTDGSADAVFLGGAIPTASITQAAATLDLVFIPFDPDAKAALARDYLFFSPATIPAGTYRNQAEPFDGLDVGSMHLITADATDEALVYEVTKQLYEHRDQVTAKHPAGRAINPRNVVRDTGTPFHPGAIRYYREIGIWPQ